MYILVLVPLPKSYSYIDMFNVEQVVDMIRLHDELIT